MNYEKLYKEALERASNLHKDAVEMENSMTTKTCEIIFPELKESEDERIRKEFCKDIWTYIPNEKAHKYIAWLERQGEQKPADKIEPKFKVGDWVIDKQGIVHQIANVVENVTNHTYGYDIIGGGYFNDNTEGVRLWSIEDAKDGDVLVDVYGNIAIFEKRFGINWHTYCYLGNEGRFIAAGGSHGSICYPATKEQRDQLEKAMANAGYTFDFEKKELKKIERKPAAWSEEDEGFLDSALWHIQNSITNGAIKSFVECPLSTWLKSLKERVQPQPKQEWSEEDSHQLNEAIEAVNESSYSLKRKEIVIDWLKSLKDRYAWKPSDEQIKVCKEVYADLLSAKGFDVGAVNSELNRLEEQLKNL